MRLLPSRFRVPRLRPRVGVRKHLKDSLRGWPCGAALSAEALTGRQGWAVCSKTTQQAGSIRPLPLDTYCCPVQTGTIQHKHRIRRSPSPRMGNRPHHHQRGARQRVRARTRGRPSLMPGTIMHSCVSHVGAVCAVGSRFRTESCGDDAQVDRRG